MAIECGLVKCQCKQSHCKECQEHQVFSEGVNVVDKLQNRDEVKKPESKYNTVDSKYGAWGDKYKNKDNFVNMHWC